MKILLTAINAKYIHSNLAIYYLKAYANKYKDNIKLCEFTINNYMEDILQAIYKEKPDVAMFSCYIWNIELVNQLCVELRKVLPNTKIWLGGPEVSYDAKMRLQGNHNVDGIMIGEGEETFKELLDYFIEDRIALGDIRGIAYRESKASEEITVTGIRPQLNFSSIPFPYENMQEFENKIIYYETSRGCPYSCSYCLSSIDKRVRLRDFDLVKKELQIFLDNKVPQVKFVDRTFNCNKKHALQIWNYIKEHDNGITNFHFEIAADILDEEELTVLNSMREGLVQLEIGVQSTNPMTIDAIHRKMDMNKLTNVVNRIHEGKNIHQHLDLIAGLPYEDYDTFKQSFCDVYALKPDQFQLGFLKVLKGALMHEESEKWGIVYKDIAPFEVLYTKWLSYDDVLKLKSVENMVEIYYNSGQFVNTIKYMEHYFSNPFEMYEALGEFYEQHNLTMMSHSRVKKYEILIDFLSEYLNDYKKEAIDVKAFSSILLHDMYLRENLKSRPSFAESQEAYKTIYRNFYADEEKLQEYLNIDSTDNASKLKPNIHLEHYIIDIEQTVATGNVVQDEQFILYNYMNRNPLNNQAQDIKVDLLTQM